MKGIKYLKNGTRFTRRKTTYGKFPLSTTVNFLILDQDFHLPINHCRSNWSSITASDCDRPHFFSITFIFPPSPLYRYLVNFRPSFGRFSPLTSHAPLRHGQRPWLKACLRSILLDLKICLRTNSCTTVVFLLYHCKGLPHKYNILSCLNFVAEHLFTAT